MADSSLLSDDIARPEPSAVMESLRAIGYSVATAVADLIDNSIAAGATQIRIVGNWSLVSPYIAVIDDGSGMSELELRQAMVLGSKSPLDERASKDLGRYGMGLKTASFSQCRKLTVGSKRLYEPICVREWDLDYVQQVKEWSLKKNTDSAGQELLCKFLSGNSGTCVLWRNLDRLVSPKLSDEKGKQQWLDMLSGIERHVSTVFHRFLSKRGRLKIFLNDREIKAWDPFLADNDFTQEFAEDLASSLGVVSVKAYVLPHKSRLTDEQIDLAGGVRGWTAQQGLYVYRKDRMLISGGWPGLGLRSEDAFNLARVSVDIPAGADADWHLDIKKSRIRPPNDVRGRLKQIAEIMQTRSKQTYHSKGKIIGRKISGEISPVWKERWKGTKLSFEINRQHPLIKNILTSAHASELKAILRVLEETVPLEQIAFYLAGNPNLRIEPFEDTTDSEDFREAVRLLDHILSTTQLPVALLQSKLLEIEPFNRYPEIVLSLLERGKEDDSQSSR